MINNFIKNISNLNVIKKIIKEFYPELQIYRKVTIMASPIAQYTRKYTHTHTQNHHHHRDEPCGFSCVAKILIFLEFVIFDTIFDAACAGGAGRIFLHCKNKSTLLRCAISHDICRRNDVVVTAWHLPVSNACVCLYSVCVCVYAMLCCVKGDVVWWRLTLNAFEHQLAST